LIIDSAHTFGGEHVKLVRLAATMLFAMICLVPVGSLQPAHAEEDPTYTWEYGPSCYSFGGDQAAAQEYFETNGQPAEFDLNGNGIACEDESDGDFTSHPSAGPDPTCGTWMDDQAAAQEYYDNHGQPAELDLNGNGTACDSPEDGDFSPWPLEEAVDPGNGPSAWPDWTCETFPDGRDAAIDYYNTNGGPATLDADGDGIACNESDGGSDSGPSAWPSWSCYTFPDGWDASIEYYNTNGGPASLDADRDGIPCESNGDDEVTECRDLGGPQSVAQEYYETHGMPENLDLDGDGLACMNEADGYWGDTEPRPASLPNEDEDVPADTDEDEAAGETGDTEPADTAASDAADERDDDSADDATAGAASPGVVKLPSTGSGATSSPSASLVLLLVGAVIAVTLASIASRHSEPN
jgi:hypothetical protein